MANQQRRQAPSQRRLSIQASSRRNQTISVQNRSIERRSDARVANTVEAAQNQYMRDRYAGNNGPEDYERYEHHEGYGRDDQDRQWHNRQWQESYDDEGDGLYGSNRYGARTWQEQRWDDQRSDRHTNGRSELDQDLQAMSAVWSMIRQGAVRMLGEIGRQY